MSLSQDAALLARNMAAALTRLRAQRMVCRILALAGPSTTGELAVYCGRHDGLMARAVKPLSRKTLQRLLTELHDVQQVQKYPTGQGRGNCKSVFWALPGQPQPDRRARSESPTQHPERRQGERRQGSWWATGSRDEFRQALERRWS